MIPLTLITGFLGSGKTTFLERAIERYRDHRLAWLVNEFSDLDVDSRRLAATGRSILCLPGGSIFCQCLASSFINVLTDLANRHHPDTPLEGVVIEASGIADPRVTGQLLAETRLDRSFHLARIITLIDPGTFTKLLNTLPNIAHQVEAADLAILNKIDLFDADTLDEAEAAVRSIQPAIHVLRTSYARVDVDLFELPPRPEVHGQLAPCRDPHYATEVFISDQPIALDRFITLAAALPDGLYRLKGRLWTGHNLHDVDWTPTSRLHTSPTTVATTRRTELTALFSPPLCDHVQAFFNRLAHTL